ncbi:LCP family protein [Holzapfeliella sp. He02]|uniref:LCP family protein n=1 Tax=Holzapfeliella saturejae TaxID=3082953 RepID=A0ABU8SEH0_9LACO
MRDDYQRNESLKRTKKMKRKTKFTHILGLALVLVIALTGANLAKVYLHAKSAINQTYHPVDNKQTTAIEEQKPISILLLGTDTGAFDRGDDRGNSDTLILATINPKTKQTTLTSVPRDMLTEIQDDNTGMQKVNSAYNIGGSSLAMKTVSSLVNVPIDYYVTVNMGALENIVDAIGGVEVDVPFAFYYGWTQFEKGPRTLTGHGALDYTRMRYDDPEGDYGRQKRQRQVIEAIAKKALSLDSVANFESIFNVIKSNMQTNLSFDNMVGLFNNYRHAAQSISSDYIHGKDAWLSGGSYQLASTDELQRISNALRQNLELSPETVDNTETKQNQLNKQVDWKDLDAEYNYTIYSDEKLKNLPKSSQQQSSSQSSSH